MRLATRVANKFLQWDGYTDTSLLDAKIAALADGKPQAQATDLIHTAWNTRKSIDLSGIVYGPETTSGKYLNTTPNYYYFLAGFVRSQHCKRILEIGTNFGGASLAMVKAGAEKIVTIDVTDVNQALYSVPQITKLTGDANNEGVFKRALVEMGTEPIDLLFLDADHRFMPTMMNFALYSMSLRPTFILLDDIHRNDSMQSLWDAMRIIRKAVDCVDIIPEIRSKDCGFGLIIC